jgi:anti-anti-sigma factor
MVDDIVVLGVIPGRTPEHAEIERLADSLVSSGRAACVVVELSALDFMSSAFIARLVALNKRMQAAERRLILCGLHPFVREAFHDSRLERVFEISDDLEAALASL